MSGAARPSAILTAAQVAADGGLDRGGAGARTARSRGRTGEHTDVWNHVEARWRCSSAGSVEAAERAYAWVRSTAARGRLVADEDRRRRGGGPLRRDQHVGLPRRRRSGTTGWSRRDEAFVRRMWPAVRRALDCVVSHAAAVRRHRLVAGVARRPARGRSTRRRCWPARRASTTRCAPGWRSPSCSTSRSPSGSSPAAGSATRCASTATCSWTSPTFSMDWYYPVLGGAVRGDAAHALLAERWDTFVEPGPRHPLRVDEPVGDRRRDLRAGAGPRRDRRPRPRAAAARRHAAPAHRRRGPTGPATCSPTTSTGPPSRRRTPPRRWSWPSTRSPTGRRAPTSCAARRWRRTSREIGLECGCPSPSVSRAGRRRRPTSGVAPASSRPPRPR